MKIGTQKQKASRFELLNRSIRIRDPQNQLIDELELLDQWKALNLIQERISEKVHRGSLKTLSSSNFEDQMGKKFSADPIP